MQTEWLVARAMKLKEDERRQKRLLRPERRQQKRQERLSRKQVAGSESRADDDVDVKGDDDAAAAVVTTTTATAAAAAETTVADAMDLASPDASSANPIKREVDTPMRGDDTNGYDNNHNYNIDNPIHDNIKYSIEENDDDYDDDDDDDDIPDPNILIRGPLTPDHLREALRRYKKDKEGGGVGFQGLSLHGRENVAVRMGGRRLFK